MGAVVRAGCRFETVGPFWPVAGPVWFAAWRGPGNCFRHTRVQFGPSLYDSSGIAGIGIQQTDGHEV
eukprot:1904831-Rhodomonas_salina.1